MTPSAMFTTKRIASDIRRQRRRLTLSTRPNRNIQPIERKVSTRTMAASILILNPTCSNMSAPRFMKIGEPEKTDKSESPISIIVFEMTGFLNNEMHFALSDGLRLLMICSSASTLVSEIRIRCSTLRAAPSLCLINRKAGLSGKQIKANKQITIHAALRKAMLYQDRKIFSP